MPSKTIENVTPNGKPPGEAEPARPPICWHCGGAVDAHGMLVLADPILTRQGKLRAPRPRHPPVVLPVLVCARCTDRVQTRERGYAIPLVELYAGIDYEGELAYLTKQAWFDPGDPLVMGALARAHALARGEEDS
jgi:hypothetical protein